MIHCLQALLFQAQLTLGLPAECLFILREIVPEKTLAFTEIRSTKNNVMNTTISVCVLSRQHLMHSHGLRWVSGENCRCHSWHGMGGRGRSVEAVIPSHWALSCWREPQSDVHYACCIVCSLFDRAGSKRWHLVTNVLPCSPSSLGGRCSAQADRKEGVSLRWTGSVTFVCACNNVIVCAVLFYWETNMIDVLYLLLVIVSVKVCFAIFFCFLMTVIPSHNTLTLIIIWC